ncbi:MAG: hypothetical protein HYS13_16655 [Planctomycetia bacterium]|nr:hypothetical protein [Planctomycetia bacterium]
MRYTVVWQPLAEGSLADLWTAATDRTAIAQAADRIDTVLGRDPMSVGESRSGSARILIVGPLVVYYEVIEGDRIARVLDVWRVRK